MIRDKKNAEKKTVQEQSDNEQSDTYSIDDMDQDKQKLLYDKKIKKLTKNMAKTLNIDCEQALKIVLMTE